MIEKELESYFDRLWCINRSLTGNGNRDTLKILSEIIDINIKEVKSGTICFDWKIPPEWNVSQAWIKDSKGQYIINFIDNNLHLLGYSTPVHKKMPLDELKKYLYTLPEHPDYIPYLTSYYYPRWGFCLSHNQLNNLKDDIYEVFIDSQLNDEGSMTYADSIIKGESEKEILFSTYICHPSMANNELSGPLVTSFIYKALKDKKLRFSYRFVFIPETIGSIYYLSKYGEYLKDNIIAGFVVTTIGDKGSFNYKRSRKGKCLVDRATELILSQTENNYILEDFFPDSGSDERQYCSPGFNLPVGSLMRTRYGKYKEYHTSADNKDFISFEAMEKSVEKYLEVIYLIENNYTYINKNPNCEPMLGKRGLYPSLGSQKETEELIRAIMWVLNLSDGQNDLIEICNKSKINYKIIIEAAKKLHENELLEIN